MFCGSIWAQISILEQQNAMRIYPQGNGQNDATEGGGMRRW